MTGLLFLAVVFLLILLDLAIATWISRRFVSRRYWKYSTLVIFLCLLPLPVADEIIGGFQFRALCKEGAQLKIDAEAIRGKAVYVTIDPSNEYLQGTAIPIQRSHFSYRDTSTDKEYANFDIYDVKGGRFIRALGIFENNAPLTMGFSSCSPPRPGSLDEQYHFTRIRSRDLINFRSTLK